MLMEHADPLQDLWECPLDVSALAWSSVHEAVVAAAALACARGHGGTFATSPHLVTSSFAAIENLRIDDRKALSWASLSGFFEAADGWVRLHGNYPHHAQAVTDTFGVTGRSDLEGLLACLPATEIETALLDHRGIATAARSASQWHRHPHGAATAHEPWRTVIAHGERRGLRCAAMPLAGVRVLDLTRVIAGPTCSQLLACLGADVLRIDPPHLPELLGHHLATGMGKRSVELDLRTDLATLRDDLLPDADVVLLGYRPGALTPFGLDAQTLTAARPDLVVGSLSAWGESGPWAHRAGFDSIVQAASGIALACGTHGKPGVLPVQALDHATGYRLAAAVMSLLTQARGGLVRISLLGAARELLTAPTADRPLGESTARSVQVPSPHGSLVAAPPPITLDGRTLERPVGGYGASAPAWLDP